MAIWEMMLILAIALTSSKRSLSLGVQYQSVLDCCCSYVVVTDMISLLIYFQPVVMEVTSP